MKRNLDISSTLARISLGWLLANPWFGKHPYQADSCLDGGIIIVSDGFQVRIDPDGGMGMKITQKRRAA